MAEHTLILLRHAKSDWSGHEDDYDRPLAKRGRRQAPEAGRWLAANVDSIDLAVVSTAKRARSTWDLVSAELDEALNTVVLVGHNPGIEDLAEALTNARVPMPTSALAVIELNSTWDGVGRAGGVLRAAGRPPTSTL